MKKLLFAVIAMCAAILAAPFIFPPGSSQPATQAIGLPWQINVLPGGKSRVFGLTPEIQHYVGVSPFDRAFIERHVELCEKLFFRNHPPTA